MEIAAQAWFTTQQTCSFSDVRLTSGTVPSRFQDKSTAYRFKLQVNQRALIECTFSVARSTTRGAGPATNASCCQSALKFVNFTPGGDVIFTETTRIGTW